MLPNIVVGCTVQWYWPPEDDSRIALLVAPGPRSPLSNDPSFMTIRCTVLSLLRQTTRLPWLIGAGFGLNDCSFLWPMMVTVAAPAGAVFEGVGAEGLALVDEFPLQPHAAKIRLATANRRSRMRRSTQARCPRNRARIRRFSEARFTERVHAYVRCPPRSQV